MSSQLFFRVSSRSINSSCRCYHHHRPRQLLLTTAVSSTPNTTRSTHNHHQHQFQYQQYQTKRMMGHTVRVIALEDLPHGKAYKGDVVAGVKAGYARNYLIPRKLALYATPQNFQRLQIVDPDDLDQQQQREATTASAVSTIEDQYLKDADLLKKYLKNKVVSVVCALFFLFCIPFFSSSSLAFCSLYLHLLAVIFVFFPQNIDILHTLLYYRLIVLALGGIYHTRTASNLANSRSQ